MMKFLLNLILVAYLLSPLSVIGQGKVQYATVNGTALDIYTPPEYSTDQRYRVVYFNDGQMLFGHPTLSMALQVTLDSMIEKKQIAPLIVVGMAADELRTEKYVPYPAEDFRRLANDRTYAEAYADHVVNEIIPYVDQNYSTITNGAGRAIYGFSFGGLNALWMVLNYPDVFSMAAGFSPSIWVSDFALFKEAEKYIPGHKIWFDIGTAEWNYYVPFQKLLKDQGARINADVFYSEVPLGLHAMSDWRKRIQMPFLIFAGTADHVPVKMDVEVEIIPSQSNPDVLYTRINPIVKCKTGLTYSLAYEARYEVADSTAGKVYEEGRFELFGEDNLDVTVSYDDFQKKVKIRSKMLVKEN